MIKRVVVLLLALVLALFVGCKKEESVSDAVQSEEEVTVSSEIDFSEDAEDPENKENIIGIGETVTAEDLENKKGMANGIDVSKWQGKIDWKAVKADGIDFAIIRIGYRGENGKIYKDSFADYNIQQADKAGLLVGVYFFSTAVSVAEATEEAEWTAEAVKGYPISYPIVYDCEGFRLSSSRMYSLSKSQRTDNALAFMAYVKNEGYDAMFYAAKSELDNSAMWDTARIEAAGKIWVAHYSEITYPQLENPQYGGRYHMWQYTNMGSVGGVKGGCDMVVSYFTAEKAAPKSNKAPQSAVAPEETNSVYKTVKDKVTAKELVNLRESASTKSAVVGSLKNGEVLDRTGVGTNGWSRLILNGKTVYAITSYLTTDLSYRPEPSVSETETVDIYSNVNETVTAKDKTNLRSVASSKDPSTVVYTLKNGETVTRTGIGSNGWSRLLYNGQTVYAVSSYLTTDLTQKQPEKEENASSKVENDGFTPDNKQVTAKSETNLRTAPSTKEGSSVVYTLKNGEYVTRVGINEASGWSKLIYNGQTVYAVTSYLTE